MQITLGKERESLTERCNEKTGNYIMSVVEDGDIVSEMDFRSTFAMLSLSHHPRRRAKCVLNSLTRMGLVKVNKIKKDGQ